LELQKLLDSLQHFSHGSAFEPHELKLQWTIAANDLQRDLLLPRLAKRLNKEAPGVSLKIISSGVPSLQLLRDRDCQLAITPRPPEGSDIYQKRIFEDQYVVFYDANSRNPPSTKEDYLGAKHISVDYDVPRPLAIDEYLNGMGIKRDFQVLVPSFAGISAFMKGSQLLATLPSLLGAHLLNNMAQCAPPFKCPKMAMYMCWHKKYSSDPVQQWLRDQLLEVVGEATA
jgi:DNA-binding transcriptional LysR family regulator